MQEERKLFEELLKEQGIEIPEFVQKNIRKIDWGDNALICIAGEPVESISFLVSGEIRIVNSFANGKEFQINSEKPITLLGDLEYLSRNMSYASSVFSVTDVTLFSIPLKIFTEWCHEDIQFYDFVVGQLARKCYHSTASSGDIKFQSSEERIRTILLLLDADPENKDGIRISHESLAQIAGLSIRTTERVLRSLKEEGFIRLEYRNIIIQK